MRRFAPGLVVGLMVVSLAACGGSSAPAGSKTAQVGDLQGQKPTQVIAAAEAAAKAAGSVRYVLVARDGSQTQTIQGVAGTDEAQQTVTEGTQKVSVTYVGGVAYVQGNAGGLASAMGLSSSVAAQYAGKWIAIQSTDSLHKSIVQAVTLTATLSQLIPTAPLEFASPTTIGGRQALAVKGSLPKGTASGVSGSTTLYVAASKPVVPLRFTGSASTGVSDTCTFSQWGTAISLTAPTGAIPFSSLPKSKSS
ncbi:MAG TPA: hypothetical protein VMB72_05845 [Acidimicrobiales bacterium]|nr:hypothetical protein [Acidimicrobiales bacterium]